MKEISLIIFIIFNLSFFYNLKINNASNVNATESSQETVFESLDTRSEEVIQNNMFDKKMLITYLY